MFERRSAETGRVGDGTKMKATIRISTAAAWLLALVLLATAGTGCGRNVKIIELDHRFSMNVLRTPYWFPGDMELTPAELEILDRYGPPNYIRFWWREDGSMITSSDLSGRDGEVIQADINNMSKSWIYMHIDKEVVFSPDRASRREQEIGELTRLICNYGDPGMRSVSPDGLRETWIWIDYGKQATLLNGRLVNVSRRQPTGAGTWTLK